jgi:hypothetical protein
MNDEAMRKYSVIMPVPIHSVAAVGFPIRANTYSAMQLERFFLRYHSLGALLLLLAMCFSYGLPFWEHAVPPAFGLAHDLAAHCPRIEPGLGGRD